MNTKVFESGHDTRIICRIGKDNDSMSKIERYQWHIQDRPGDLRRLEKRKLIVDHTYQREVMDKKVLDMARDWSWIACGVIIVAYRDGNFYIIDGQHRWAAAMRRSDINQLPCIVFKTKSMKSEAKGFYEAQTKRKPLYGSEKLPALIAMENPEALLVKKLVALSGRRIAKSSGPNSIQCVSTLLKLAKESPDLLEKLWPLIIKLTEGHTMTDRLISGIFYLEKNLIEGQSLLDKVFNQKILKIGYEEIINGIGKATAFYSKGGSKIYATGILQTINKNSYKNILEMKG